MNKIRLIWILTIVQFMPFHCLAEQDGIKKYIITTATSGFGNAISEKLLSEGHHVILLGRDHQKLNALENDFSQKYPGKITVFRIDYADLDGMKVISEKVVGQSIDGIVVMTPRPNLGTDLFPSTNAWTEMFQTCFLGPLKLLEYALPKLKDHSKIVVINGLTSIEVLPNHPHYGVLRTMWLSEAKSLSFALAQRSIHVNSISPAGVLTESFREKMALRAKNNNRSIKQQLEIETDNIPLKKYGSPDEIASIISFYLSPASNHISGTNIVVDGGFHRSYY